MVAGLQPKGVLKTLICFQASGTTSRSLSAPLQAEAELEQVKQQIKSLSLGSNDTQRFIMHLFGPSSCSFRNAFHGGVTLLVFVRRGGLLLCCVVFQAAGVALCYGNNNGGACAAGTVHPLAPNVAQSSPRLFSGPARLSNKKPSPPLSFYSLPRLLCLPLSGFTFCLRPSRFLLLSISPTFCASCLFLLQPLLSISSFLLPHKDIHSPVALRGEQNVL